jgi:hypothetical protein
MRGLLQNVEAIEECCLLGQRFPGPSSPLYLLERMEFVIRKLDLCKVDTDVWIISSAQTVPGTEHSPQLLLLLPYCHLCTPGQWG